MTRVPALLAALLGLGALLAAAPSPSPPPYTILPAPTPSDDGGSAAPGGTPIPSPDPVGENDLRLAREAWRGRTDVPFVRYGALIRYEHNKHVFDNWWDAYFRSSDGALALHRLVDVDEDRRRLKGIPFSIFGVKIFDTNPDAEPIRLDEPRIDPAFSFGLLSRLVPVSQGGAAPAPTDSDGLRQIAVVGSSARAYDVRYAGTTRLGDVDALHLTFTPLRDPKVNRIRALWLEPGSYRTMQMRVQGILNGKPYDAVSWTVRYVVVEGRNYLQQVVADEPLHFGLDTTIPRMEFDFFDYRFPSDVPKFTFDGRIF